MDPTSLPPGPDGPGAAVSTRTAETRRDAADGTTARRAHVAVVVVFFVHGLLFASWAPHIPHVKAHLGVGDGTLGLALLGTPVGSIIAIGLAARLVPRLGSRRVVQLSLAGYCLVGPAVGLVGTVPGLLLALLAWGVFQGTLDVSMNTAAIAVEGRRGRALMNGIHAWWSMGAFAGAGLGTLAVAVGISLWVQLLAMGVLALVVAGALSTRMLDDRHLQPAAPPPTDARDTSAASTGAPARQRTLSAGMLVLGAIAFASMLCEGAAADWSSVYIRDSLAGGATAGLGYTVFALAMFLVRLSGDRALARFSPARLLSGLSLGAAVVFAAALLVGATSAALVGFFALGLGLGAVVPTVFSAAGRLPGIHPGVGVAGVSGLGWAGFVCGPPLIGQLAGLTSLPAALTIVPVLTVLIAVGCLRTPALRRRATAGHGAT